MEFNTKSTIGKAIGRALKNQAVESAKNLNTDLISGKEGVEREVNNNNSNIKRRAMLGLQPLNEYNDCRELKRKTNKKPERWLFIDYDRSEEKKNPQVKKKKNIKFCSKKRMKNMKIY